jgi:hypothetical protein
MQHYPALSQIQNASKRNVRMKKNQSLNRKLLSLMASALAWGATAQTLPPMPPDPPPPPSATPVVTILASDPTALVGASSGAFTLIRTDAINVDLVVDVALSGSAFNGVDYTAIPEKLTIPAGFLAVDVPVLPLVVPANRGNKTVVLTVLSNETYRKGRARATVTLLDDLFNAPPPTVTLTSPTDGSVFNYPAAITLQAEVSDSELGIRSVSFYEGDDLLGKVTASPYTLVWTTARPGHYVLFARVTDQADRSALSAPVHIAVTKSPPVVELVTPTNGMTFTAGQSVTIEAKATGSDGNPIQNVSFYASGRALGVVTTAPYTLVWANVPAGTYVIRAVATDQAGDKANAKPAMIKVLRTGKK